MSSENSLYATCAAGLAPMLADELTALGAVHASTAGAGVRFNADLALAYRACLWSRIANRILLPIHSGPAATPEALYELVREVDWATHMRVEATLAVDFFTANSDITHSQYGALKVKDAVVDQFRESAGVRPNVERETPDLRINVYLFRNKARIAIDLSGSSLHRRGYREMAGPAPIKENLAAALLMACEWPARSARGEPFVDPLCGSGTLAIEAAMIACNQAPGLYREYFGFTGWLGHDEQLWQQVKAEALAARTEPTSAVVAADKDAKAVSLATTNARLAHVDNAISFSQADLLSDAALTDQAVTGLVLCNPPYGERLPTDHQFYMSFGTALSEHYPGWFAGVFTAVAAPVRDTRLPLKTLLELRNGSIDCALYTGEIPGLTAGAASAMPEVDAQPFVNRLRKNQKNLKSWLKRESISAWRVYDADLPEFSVAIDVYDCDQRHVVVQEYQAPATVNKVMAAARLDALMAQVPEVLAVSSANVHLKHREIQSGRAQYQKQSRQGVTAILEEAGCSYELNFSDYLDTGLFLDHRKVRRYVQEHINGKRFLNLFAYTGAVTVNAIIGGAAGSVSVDLSNRYCQWMQRNISNNTLCTGADASAHRVVRSDVGKWLAQNPQEEFDLILLDPPTFSNSTDVDADWNVQRDHAAMIHQCMQLLAAGGTLIFSNNFRRFKLDTQLSKEQGGSYAVHDKSRWSIDKDFQRNARIHQCWFISQ